MELEQNSVFCRSKEFCTPEFIAAVGVPAPGLYKIKPTNIPGQKEKWLPSPTLAEELLVVDGCWERKSQFSLRVRSLVDRSCCSRWFYILECVCSKNWFQWILTKKDVTWGGEMKDVAGSKRR